MESIQEDKDKRKNVETEKNNENMCEISEFGKNIFYILGTLLIIFCLIDCFIVIQGVAEGIPMWKIRRWGMEVAGSENNPLVARRSFIEGAFRAIILTPFSTLIPPIAAL